MSTLYCTIFYTFMFRVEIDDNNITLFVIMHSFVHYVNSTKFKTILQNQNRRVPTTVNIIAVFYYYILEWGKFLQHDDTGPRIC